MTLTPEERRKIYEEEKARIDSETQEQAKSVSSTGLPPNLAGMLCYLGWWISGIVFIVLEQKNRLVRFHAIQSIALFGAVQLCIHLTFPIPFIGWFFGTMIAVGGVILWILLMVRTYHGETVRIPGAADLADRILGPAPGAATGGGTPGQPSRGSDVVPAAAAQQTGPTPSGTGPQARGGRGGRIAASAVAIAWCVALLVFLNFFNGYIAYYHLETVRGVETWVREPLLTSDFRLWQPVVSVVLVLSIAGHAMLLAIDSYVLREATLTVIDVLALASLSVLLRVFPFDFSVFGNSALTTGLRIGVRVTLALIIFGVAIGIVVRLVKLLVNLIGGKTAY